MNDTHFFGKIHGVFCHVRREFFAHTRKKGIIHPLNLTGG